MKAIKIAMLMTALVAPAHAQSYVEGNATDAVCEWHFKQKSGIEKCHINAMGVIAHGDQIMEIAVDGMVVDLIEKAEGQKIVKIGDWTGTYTDTYSSIGEGPAGRERIKLSNGYTIDMVY